MDNNKSKKMVEELQINIESSTESPNSDQISEFTDDEMFQKKHLFKDQESTKNQPSSTKTDDKNNSSSKPTEESNNKEMTSKELEIFVEARLNKHGINHFTLVNSVFIIRTVQLMLI